MSRHHINEIKRYFKENDLNATDDWLEGCMEWAMGNQPPSEQTLTKLQDFAYQQWLLADLREIGTGCLPANTADQHLTILTGNYAVQAEKFLDIANPLYTQLKLLRGGNIEVEGPENPERDDQEEELNEWGKGPKKVVTKLKTRKLQFTLCDGKVEVKALEYRPLQQLKGMVYPGVKLLIVGPVECRRGMLLLENKHVKVLGGEVDTLMTSNAPENLMAKALGLPENADPYKGLQSTVGEAGCVVQSARVAAVAPRGRQPPPNIHVAPVVRAQAQPPTQVTRVIQQECIDDYDDFDLTEEDLLALEMSEQLETSGIENRGPTIQTGRGSVNMLRPIAPQNLIRPIPVYAGSGKPQLNARPILYSGGPQMTRTSANPQRPHKAPQAKTKPVPIEEDYIEMDLDDLESQISAYHFTQNLSNASNSNATSTYKTGSLQTCQNKNTSKNNEDLSHVNPRLPDNGKMNLNQRKPVETCVNQNRNLKNEYNPKPGFTSASTSNHNNNKPKESPCKRTSVVADNFDDMDDWDAWGVEMPKVQNQGQQKASAILQQPPTKKLKGVQSDIRSFAVTPNKSEASSKPNLARFLSKQTPKPTKRAIAVKKVATSPFVYLIQLKEAQNRPQHAVVKACVVTLLQKLKAQDGLWNLKLKIADGSTSLDVQFSNEVLEELIGFSVPQFEAIKVGAKENPIMKEKLAEFVFGLKELKKKLIDLICLMHLEFPPQCLPCVTYLESITLKHAQAFKARV